MAEDAKQGIGKRAAKCPICGKPVEPAYRPFCSPRCRDVDLARWLGGGYAIAGGSTDADEDGEQAAAEHAAGQGAEPRGDDGGGDGGGGGD